jgi:hypothetical protein
VGILTAAFLLSIGLALREVAGPAIASLRNILASGAFTAGRIFMTMGIMTLQMALGALVSILSLFFTMILLKVLSPFKDLKAVGNNNIAMAVILAAAMLVTTLLISEPLNFLLQGFIPEVEIPAPGML